MAADRSIARCTPLSAAAAAAGLFPACSFHPDPQPVRAPAVAGQCIVGRVPDEEFGGTTDAALARVLATGTAERPDTSVTIRLPAAPT